MRRNEDDNAYDDNNENYIILLAQGLPLSCHAMRRMQDDVSPLLMPLSGERLDTTSIPTFSHDSSDSCGEGYTSQRD
jgi:hypothetical protein